MWVKIEAPTPETDADNGLAGDCCAQSEVVSTELARRLERERDEARRERDRLKKEVQDWKTILLSAVGAVIWRPIETFDKRKKSVLLFCEERKNIYTCSWRDGTWFHVGTNNPLLEWPTHWMPTPDAPEQTEGGV